jgi:hypothetical protein
MISAQKHPQKSGGSTIRPWDAPGGDAVCYFYTQSLLQIYDLNDLSLQRKQAIIKSVFFNLFGTVYEYPYFPSTFSCFYWPEKKTFLLKDFLPQFFITVSRAMVAFSNINSSLPDSNLESGKKQGPSKWELVSLKQNFNFEKSQGLKRRSEKF